MTAFFHKNMPQLTHLEKNNGVLAKYAHQIAHQQALRNRDLLDEAGHFVSSAREDIRRGSNNTRRLLAAFRRERMRPPHPRPHARPGGATALFLTGSGSSERLCPCLCLCDAPAMIVVNAYHGLRVVAVGALDDVVAERAHAAQRVHPRDGLVRHLPARHDADVSRRPRVPGDDEPAGRVRAHVRQERVGRDVHRLLLLHARVVPAPAVAHDVQHDEPVGEVRAEVSPRRRGGGGGAVATAPDCGGMPVAVAVRRPRMWHRVLRDGQVAG